MSFSNCPQQINPSLRRAFTLIELLVVIAVIAIIAAILFPVFQKVRENARRATCASNQKQIGIALVQYAQDNDDAFPIGTFLAPGIPFGLGWAGQCYPYIKSVNVFHCPDDPTMLKSISGSTSYPVSYGLNIDVTGDSSRDLTAPASTVMLFEVRGDTALIIDGSEGTQGNTVAPPSGMMSPASDGVTMGCRVLGFMNISGVTIVKATANDAKPPTIQFDTGAIGSRWTPNVAPSQKPGWFVAETGRHSDGANYLFSDGHSKYYLPQLVSTGSTAVASDCNQGNSKSQPVDCQKAMPGDAQGAANSQPFAVTFSDK